MSEGYKAKLKDGQEIYIATWTPSVALENLTQAGKYIGLDNLLNISKLTKLSMHAVIVAISEAEDSETTLKLIQHFICTVGMDGDRITEATFDTIFEGKLPLIVEVFTHVVHSQYADFFEQGLIEV